ncbi:MAG: helix-turn-helix transcriptional regulator [Bacilli bacterium]
MSLNDNLRRLIKENKLNITKISKDTGVDRATIHRLIAEENENPKINTVKALANYFELTIDELIK